MFFKDFRTKTLLNDRYIQSIIDQNNELKVYDAVRKGWEKFTDIKHKFPNPKLAKDLLYAQARPEEPLGQKYGKAAFANTKSYGSGGYKDNTTYFGEAPGVSGGFTGGCE